MNRWGYDEPNGNIIGTIKTAAQIFYDKRPQGQKYYSNNEQEAITAGKKRIKELTEQYGGFPCYLYSDKSKWEIRIYE